jgi:hypothetical protein
MEMKRGDDYLANFTLALLEYAKSSEQTKKWIKNSMENNTSNNIYI